MKFVLLFFFIPGFFEWAIAEQIPPQYRNILIAGKDRIPDGFHKVYNRNFQIVAIAEFSNQKIMSGKVFVYDHIGFLKYTRLYENGRCVKVIYENTGFISNLKFVLESLVFDHLKNQAIFFAEALKHIWLLAKSVK